MKEIKAFIHRNRLADVVHALRLAGFRDISIVDVKGMLKALGAREQEYSIEIGNRVVTEVKLEFVCEDRTVNHAVNTIRRNGRTGRSHSGWIYVSNIDSAYEIDGGDEL